MTDDDATTAREALRGRACRWCGQRAHGTPDADGWGCCPACRAGSEQHGALWPVVECLRLLGVATGDAAAQALLRRHSGRAGKADEQWSHVPVVATPSFAETPDASPHAPAAGPWRHLREHVVPSAAVDKDRPTVDRGVMVHHSTGSRYAPAWVPNRLQLPVIEAVESELAAITAIRRQAASVSPPDGSAGCWGCGVARAPRGRWRMVRDRAWCGDSARCPEPHRPGDVTYASSTLRAVMIAHGVDGARAVPVPSLLAARVARQRPWLYSQQDPQPAPSTRPWRWLTSGQVAAIVASFNHELERTTDPSAWEARHAREAREAAENQKLTAAVRAAVAELHKEAAAS